MLQGAGNTLFFSVSVGRAGYRLAPRKSQGTTTQALDPVGGVRESTRIVYFANKETSHVPGGGAAS